VRKGLAYIRVKEDGEIDTIGAIKDNLSPEQKAELLTRTQAKPGHLLLFGAGDTAIVNKTLDRLRQVIARQLGMIDDSKINLLWITDFPMFEWNADEKRLEALHHPFTAPNPDDLDDIKNARALAYDMVYNGLEIGGGQYADLPTGNPGKSLLRRSAYPRKKPIVNLAFYLMPLTSAPPLMRALPMDSIVWLCY
jgi:aspartyl-tRNA synthetase